MVNNCFLLHDTNSSDNLITGKHGQINNEVLMDYMVMNEIEMAAGMREQELELLSWSGNLPSALVMQQSRFI